MASCRRYKNVVIYQANTKNAYLNPYPRNMELPPLYRQLRDVPAELADLAEDEVLCQLLKPHYGTKQGTHRCGGVTSYDRPCMERV